MWLSLAPVGVFLATNRVAGLRWAVAATTACSLATIVYRRRRNQPLGRLFPLITAAIVARGAIGIATGSDAVYFGLGIAGKFAVAAILVGTALNNRPLGRQAIAEAFELPTAVRTSPHYAAALRSASVVAGAYYTLSACFDVWLFRRSSVNEYVAVRFIASWPLAIIALSLALWRIQTHLTRIRGVESLASLIDPPRERSKSDGFHS